MKICLVTTSLEDPDRLKRFEKILKRKTTKRIEMWPNCWVVLSKFKPNRLNDALNTVLDSPTGSDGEEIAENQPINERLFITTVGPDDEHRNGWLTPKFWKEVCELEKAR
jgi:hypothetical protein